MGFDLVTAALQVAASLVLRVGGVNLSGALHQELVAKATITEEIPRVCTLNESVEVRPETERQQIRVSPNLLPTSLKI